MPFVRIYYQEDIAFSLKKEILQQADKNTLLRSFAESLTHILARHLLGGSPKKDSWRVKVKWEKVDETYMNMPPISIRIEAGWSKEREENLDSIIKAVEEDIRKIDGGLSFTNLLLKISLASSRVIVM